jgi:hypothetical protein
MVLVPEAGIEPARARGPEDFESSASTSFTTPALAVIIILKRINCQYNNPNVTIKDFFLFPASLLSTIISLRAVR